MMARWCCGVIRKLDSIPDSRAEGFKSRLPSLHILVCLSVWLSANSSYELPHTWQHIWWYFLLSVCCAPCSFRGYSTCMHVRILFWGGTRRWHFVIVCRSMSPGHRSRLCNTGRAQAPARPTPTRARLGWTWAPVGRNTGAATPAVGRQGARCPTTGDEVFAATLARPSLPDACVAENVTPAVAEAPMRSTPGRAHLGWHAR